MPLVPKYVIRILYYLSEKGEISIKKFLSPPFDDVLPLIIR